MLQLTITGNLGADATTKEINGTTYLAYNVGVASTLWVSVFSRYQEGGKMLNVLRKGTKVMVQGMPSLGAYTNKAGKAIGTLTIWAREQEILQWADKPAEDKGSEVTTSTPTEEEANDLPF